MKCCDYIREYNIFFAFVRVVIIPGNGRCFDREAFGFFGDSKKWSGDKPGTFRFEH